MKEKMYALYVTLLKDFKVGSSYEKKYMDFDMEWDDAVWENILKRCHETHINTILLEVNNAYKYKSHPEINHPDAWDKKRVDYEIDRCEKLGIKIIPLLNFSAIHSSWLGKYYRMTSTSEYYAVCKDLIEEIYFAFQKPEYINIGMDEESFQFCEKRDFVMFRQGELYWHDLRYLVDCVKNIGAKPWMWSNPLFEHPEEYKKRFAPDEVLLSPYHYNAFRKEHFTPIESRSEYLVYYNEGKYKEMGIKYVEEDPFLVKFIELAIPLMKEGYLYVPCMSVFNRCKYNHDDLIEYFEENAPSDQILGYLSAPWMPTTAKGVDFFEETFVDFKNARDKFCK